MKLLGIGTVILGSKVVKISNSKTNSVTVTTVNDQGKKTIWTKQEIEEYYV